MQLSPRSVISAAVGIAVGNMIAERWVLRASPEDPTGFVDVSPGFGLDEIARAAVIIPAMGAVDALFRRFWK